MTREERVAGMEARLAGALRPSAFPAPTDRPLVDSIPASSPLIKDVRADLQRAADAAHTPPELRRRLRAVLAGEESLAAVLRSGLLPIPSGDALPQDVKDVIESVEEGTPE